VIMTAPGTILLAKMLVPETETPETAGTVKLASERVDANVIGAAARGTSDGLHLALTRRGHADLVPLARRPREPAAPPRRELARRAAQPGDDPRLRVHARWHS